MERVLEPEWLDSLAPYDPRAQRSRADLRRINCLMGNARHVARALRGARRIVEIGAGDGSFMQAVVRRLRTPGVEVMLVDRIPAVARAWRTTAVVADAHEFLARPQARFDALVANLFLHHFEREPLRRLLALAARRTRLFVACEPRRSALALHASRLLGLLGCNEVTRHDALISVRAGFVGRELSALWPSEDGWMLAEGRARPFGHLFVARRAPL